MALRGVRTADLTAAQTAAVRRLHAAGVIGIGRDARLAHMLYGAVADVVRALCMAFGAKGASVPETPPFASLFPLEAELLGLAPKRRGLGDAIEDLKPC